jgi:hypothetical protein
MKSAKNESQQVTHDEVGLCPRKHKHADSLIRALTNVNVQLEELCVGCAYEMGYKMGYDAAFGTFEKRIENLIFRWDLAPETAGKPNNEKEESSTKTIRIYRQHS